MYLRKTTDRDDWDDAYQNTFGRTGFAFSHGLKAELVSSYEGDRHGYKTEFSPEFMGEIVLGPNGEILIWSNGRLIS